MTANKKRLLLRILWGTFMLSLLTISVVDIRIATRSKFFSNFFQYEGYILSFGNDVIQYTYIIGGIGLASALALWLLKRKTFLTVSTCIFAVLFGIFVFLNQTDRVCEVKKKEYICAPTLYRLGHHLDFWGHM